MTYLWWLLVPAGYFLILFLIAKFSIKPPRVPAFLSPGALEATQEDVSFTSADGTVLRGWWMPNNNSKAVAVLCHGYVMNRSELVTVAKYLWDRGFACLVFDFRAHGKSDGRKCGFGWLERHDVLAAADFAASKVGPLPLVLVGSSMGAAACAFACAERPGLASALILDSAYGRLSEASTGWWRFLGGKPLAIVLGPTLWLNRFLLDFNPYRIDVADALKRSGELPVLLMHGDADDLALPTECKRNLAACLGDARVVFFPGCGHSEGRWVHPYRYNAELLSFLSSVGLVDGPVAVER